MSGHGGLFLMQNASAAAVVESKRSCAWRVEHLR